MTEAEWLALKSPLMLLHIEQIAKPSEKKMRLLAVAYARYLESQPQYSDAKHVSHLGDEVAEGRATTEELWNPQVRGWGYDGHWGIANLVLAPSDRLIAQIQKYTYFYLGKNVCPQTEGSFVERQYEVARLLILCVLGNPFRPVVVEPGWLTSDVLALATSIYIDRTFDRLPILADALQDAGCNSDELLSHLRSDTEHVKGCWALDLVLGKS